MTAEGGRPRQGTPTGSVAARLVLVLVLVLVLALSLAAAPAVADFDAQVALETFDQVHELVAETHYDFDRFAESWAEAGLRLRPQAAAAEDSAALRRVLTELLNVIGDSHYNVIPRSVFDGAPEPGAEGSVQGFSGADVRLVDDRLIVVSVATDSPAARAGLRPGAIVTRAADRRLDESLARLDELQDGPAKLHATMYLEAFWRDRLAHPPVDDTLEFEALQPGAAEATSIRIQPETLAMNTVRIGTLPPMVFEFESRTLPVDEDCAGLVRFTTWVPDLGGRMAAAFPALSECAGLVFDLRGNPGGVLGMLMTVSAYLYDEVTTLGTMRSPQGEIHFRALPKRVEMDGTRVRPFAGPVAILVDRQSASTSELFAAGLQSTGRARVFGQPTPGMALPAGTRRLASGDILMYVIADYTGPDGLRVEGAGVIPDESVKLSPDNLSAGNDPVLDAALAWLGLQAIRAADLTERTENEP